MRSTIIALCVLGMPCFSSAQSTASSWANLNTLHSGQKIQVVEMNSKKDSGTFLNFTDGSLSMQEGSSPRTIDKHDVRSVKLIQHNHRLRNAVILGAVGAGAGAGIGTATYGNGSKIGFSKGDAAAFGAVVGFVGGSAIGALLPTGKIIYRVGGAS